jgi:hypothetical protein
MAHAVNPRAQVRHLGPNGDAVQAWEIVIDPDAEPIGPHPLAEMVNMHEITTFDLTARPETPVELSSKP